MSLAILQFWRNYTSNSERYKESCDTFITIRCVVLSLSDQQVPEYTARSLLEQYDILKNVNVKFVNHAEVTEYLRIDNVVDSCSSWGTFVSKRTIARRNKFSINWNLVISHFRFDSLIAGNQRINYRKKEIFISPIILLLPRMLSIAVFVKSVLSTQISGIKPIKGILVEEVA